jgi:phosphoglycerate dehydrogenase-like enzyme
MVPRLRGRRLALIGLGGIGTAIAKRAAAFGLEVRGICRTPRKMEHLDAVYGRQGLHGLAAWCDALVIAAPLTPETAGMIDAAVIACLRKGAIVVHLARGGIVDERALLARLEAGTLSAALDVFVDEPLAETSPFFGLANVIVTPHVAGFGEGYLEKAVEMLLENVARLERGEPRFGLVDRVLGY